MRERDMKSDPAAARSADAFDGDGSDLDHGKANDASHRTVRRELVANYSRYRAVALRQLRDATAADDVVQEFALKALERAHQLREPQAVRGWLRRLLQTTLVDFCRRRSTIRQREFTFELELHDTSQDGSAYEPTDPARTVSAALACIKKEYADVIVKLDLQGQAIQAAADTLGITVNNLTVRAHRSRKALRDAINAMPMRSRNIKAESDTARRIVPYLDTSSSNVVAK